MHRLETFMEETKRNLYQHHREHSLSVEFCKQYLHKIIMRLALILAVWTIVFIIYAIVTPKN